MYLTFPKLSRKLYYSSFALWFSGFPFPHLHLRRLFLGEFSPNGVWAVICHVPLSVTQTRWQRPWGISSHCATWTTNTCAYIMAGSEKEHGDGRKLLYTAREYKRETLTVILQRRKSCINHDNTLRRQPPLHQWRDTASRRGEGSSQCCWIYSADVAWGVWGGRALASCAGRPAYFP